MENVTSFLRENVFVSNYPADQICHVYLYLHFPDAEDCLGAAFSVYYVELKNETYFYLGMQMYSFNYKTYCTLWVGINKMLMPYLTLFR